MVNYCIHLSKDLFVCFIVYLTLSISFNAVAEETNKAYAEVFISASALHVPGAENTPIYVIDRIDQLQQELSKDLPSDPVKAKQEALQRFQVMDSRLSVDAKSAVTAIADTAPMDSPYRKRWQYHNSRNRCPNHECGIELYALDASWGVLLAAVLHLRMRC